MSICPNCKKELTDGIKFCTSCGSPVEETTPVTEKTPVTEESPVTEEAPAAETPSTVHVQALFEKIKKVPMKTWAIVAGVVVVLIVVIAIIAAVLGAGSSEKYAVYLKDGELHLNMLGGKESIELTSKFLGGEDEDYGSYVGAYAIDLVKLSPNGKTIFYPDKFDASTYTFDLYYRSTADAKADDEKIASNVRSYEISPNGKKIIYLNDKGLYEYDFSDDEKIDGDVANYWISEDCKTIVYTTTDGDLYKWQSGKDSDKLESNVNVYYVSEDLSTVFFTEDTELYVKKGEDDKEKVDENVYEVVQAYDNGSVYYIKMNTVTTTMTDYVIDDYVESDAAMERPTYPSYYDYEWPVAPDYPWSWEYATDEEYQQALLDYDAAYAAYEAENERISAQYQADEEQYYVLLDEWYAKGDRDFYREYFDSYSYDVTSIALYYYDGKESTEVVSNIDAESYTDGYYGASSSEDAPVMLFFVSNAKEVEKVRIEDISDIYTFNNQIEDALETMVSLAVARADESKVIHEGEAANYVISMDAKKVYYIIESEENYMEGTLYEVSVDGKIGEASEYESGVYVYNLSTLDNGEVVYYKEMDTDLYFGTLYIGKEEIAEDVNEIVTASKDDKAFYLITEADGNEGTLCYYKDGELEEIADDVYVGNYGSFVITEEGGVLYLADYSTSSQEGELYYTVNGKEGTEIDDDVVMIVAPYAW